MQKKIFLCVVFFILYIYGTSSISIEKTYHEWASYQRTNDQNIIIYFNFYPASCADKSPLFSTSVSVDFNQLDVFSFESKGPSSSQIKVSCNDGNIQSEACASNSSCYTIGVGVCSLLQDGVLTIKDITEIFDMHLNEILLQLQQNRYQFSDLLNAFDEDWETIVNDFDITIKQLLLDYGVNLRNFVATTGATLQQLLEEFNLDFDEFVKETDSTLNNILSTFNYDLSSLVTDFHITLSDIENLFDIPFKDVLKQFDLDLQSVERTFSLTIPQVIKQLNMDISKFLSLFDMSIQEFVKQTGASIEDILNWFNITFETFVNETNLALDEILKIFNVGLHDVFEIASMSVQDFIDFFGYSMKTFVQSFGLGINDVLNVFGIGFADFIKLMQYSITELFSIFDNFFDDISDLVQWLFDNLSKDVCEVIHILCPSLFSCFGLGSLCDLRRTAIPFNDIRQQTGNLYVSVSSSSQGSCSQKNSGSQSSTSSSSGGGSGVSCFSGNSRVHLDSFHTKSMEQLQVGDIILDAKGKPTQVIGWLHRDEYQEANFAHVHFTNMSNTLIISGEHLVFSSNGAIQSKTIVPGNTLLKTNTGVITVQSVKWFTSKGVYAPLTSSGTLLVNGIACSCYAYFPSHRVANLFVPMIWKLLRPFHNYHDILSLAPFVIQRWTRHFK